MRCHILLSHSSRACWPPAMVMRSRRAPPLPGTSTSGMSAMRAASAKQALIINTGDSWAIRNNNCEIAPIHGILNRVSGCAVQDCLPQWHSVGSTAPVENMSH